jgi:hypothetical protein
LSASLADNCPPLKKPANCPSLRSSGRYSTRIGHESAADSTRWINRLDVDAIPILCKASAAGGGKIVVDSFLVLPGFLAKRAFERVSAPVGTAFGFVPRD